MYAEMTQSNLYDDATNNLYRQNKETLQIESSYQPEYLLLFRNGPSPYEIIYYALFEYPFELSEFLFINPTISNTFCFQN